LTLEEGEGAIWHLKDSMNMVGSPKLQQMHLCSHLWIYFLSGMLHIHAFFLVIFKSKFWFIFDFVNLA